MPASTLSKTGAKCASARLFTLKYKHPDALRVQHIPLHLLTAGGYSLRWITAARTDEARSATEPVSACVCNLLENGLREERTLIIRRAEPYTLAYSIPRRSRFFAAAILNFCDNQRSAPWISNDGYVYQGADGLDGNPVRLLATDFNNDDNRTIDFTVRTGDRIKAHFLGYSCAHPARREKGE